MEKFEALKANLKKYPSAVIAFSGGVDSTFLARVAKDCIDKLLLITATSSTYPFYELDESKKLAKQLNVDQQVIVSEEIDIPGFSKNPPDRCYYCKGELFDIITHIAREGGYAVVFDGSIADDLSDYRPGRRALKEHGVISPLCDVGLTKEEIRALSREYGLATAEKPAYACLASRFPYGEEITKEKLDRVGKAEFDIRNLGLVTFRVRSHENLARIEVAPAEMDRAWEQRAHLQKICKDAGFVYASLDLTGYRTGAMNEMLKEGVGGVDR